MPETSIIIRAKNEERWIGECLRRLERQTNKDFEIIVVDSGSTDRTLDIVRRSAASVLHIKPEEFSYPYALNYGCSRAQAKKYFVLLSAHSLPISDHWLEDGLSNFTLYPSQKIMGVYGRVRALPNATVWEKLFFNSFLTFIGNGFRRRNSIRKSGMGVLGFTNAIIRRDLWEENHFDEAYGLGGEDGVWAKHWFGKGYAAIRDLNFSVLHSHGLGLIGLIQQQKYWYSLSRPQPFAPLQFRKNV